MRFRLSCLSIILFSIYTSHISAQRVINYNTIAAPTSPAESEALANIFTRRNPQNDFFYNDVRNDVSVEKILAKASGSPYVNEKFKPCRIVYKNEETGFAYYRFNAHNNEIELKENVAAEKIFSLNIDPNIAIKDLENNELILLKRVLDSKEKVSNSYVNLLLTSNTINLYRRTYIKFSEGTEATNSMVIATNDKFTPYQDYFVETENSKALQLVKPNKKSLYEIFPELKDSIKSIIKEQSLNLKKEDDLVTLIEGISKLIT